MSLLGPDQRDWTHNNAIPFIFRPFYSIALLQILTTIPISVGKKLNVNVPVISAPIRPRNRGREGFEPATLRYNDAEICVVITIVITAFATVVNHPRGGNNTVIIAL